MKSFSKIIFSKIQEIFMNSDLNASDIYLDNLGTFFKS